MLILKSAVSYFWPAQRFWYVLEFVVRCNKHCKISPCLEISSIGYNDYIEKIFSNWVSIALSKVNNNGITNRCFVDSSQWIGTEVEHFLKQEDTYIKIRELKNTKAKQQQNKPLTRNLNLLRERERDKKKSDGKPLHYEKRSFYILATLQP